jgi:hypothetical protein
MEFGKKSLQENLVASKANFSQVEIDWFVLWFG